jgi:hypothetical protein
MARPTQDVSFRLCKVLRVRLLNRTTRSVALTEVGERLLAELWPALDSFEARAESVRVFRGEPAGHLRPGDVRHLPISQTKLKGMVRDSGLASGQYRGEFTRAA